MKNIKRSVLIPQFVQLKAQVCIGHYVFYQFLTFLTHSRAETKSGTLGAYIPGGTLGLKSPVFHFS